MLSSRKMKCFMIFLAILLFNTAVLAENNLDSFNQVNENEYLKLYINEETAEIAVEKKNSGEIWFSNPPDRDSMEQMASGRKRDALNSQLSIEFYNPSDRLFNMDSYTDGILNNQYQISKISDGVRVDFELGKKWEENDYTPGIIGKERFENEILANLSESQQKFILKQYHLITMTELEEDEEHLGIYGVDMKKLFGNYDIKVLSENMSDKDRRLLIQDYLKNIVEAKEYTGLGNIKAEDIKPLKENSAYILKSDILSWDTGKIVNSIKESGYTPGKIQEDHQKFNFTPPWPNIKNFKLAIEYLLDGEDLLVRIPGNSIEYPRDVIDQTTGDRVTLPLTNISVLPYFEAGNIEAEGYMFIPDGSGGLIHLNSNKTDISPYEKSVYGRDYSKSSIEELGPYLEQQIHMPIYGISKGYKGFLSIIEKGDSLAKINAEVAGMRDSYNKVYPKFEVIPKSQVTLEGSLSHLSINMYQARNYDRDILIRYKLLTSENNDYSSMASIYRNYLVDKYDLKKISSDTDIPFLLEILGGINKVEPVFGVPTRTVKPLTTYSQAEDLINKLNNKGIENMAVVFNGWLDGGIEHTYPDKATVEGKLGNKNDFYSLISLIKKKNIDFYPEVSFLNIYHNKLFDGFNAYRDNARFINRKYAFIYDQFWLDTYQSDDDKTKIILSPRSLEGLVDDFIEDYQDYGINGLSLRFMAQQINSDYRTNPNQLIDREQAKEILIKQLQKIKDIKKYNLNFRGGNIFTAPYTDYYIESPIYSGSKTIFDEGIPFYQMVLHGYIQYSGQPINLAEKPEIHLLKLLEIGGLPYYRWSYEKGSVVKKSEYNDQFSIYYGDHLEEAVKYYNEVNSILAELQDKEIIKHEKLDSDIYKVLYENGSYIIINYSQEKVEVDGFIINSQDYKFIRGDM
ncbi:MAG: DUF5696 domain-containing protein [Halanaerobiaceae bacterium]